MTPDSLTYVAAYFRLRTLTRQIATVMARGRVAVWW